MKKYIYCNYFSDSNLQRRLEFLHCIYANLSLDFIDGMIVFLEREEHKNDLPDNPKIQYVLLNRRMEFQDAVEHAQTQLEPQSIVIILNLDIFLEDSDQWRNIDQEFFQVGHNKKALALTRHHIQSLDDPQITIEVDSWLEGHFCDAWILKTPLDPEFLKQDFRFCVGHAPQCDNLMMGLMSNYYHTYSWGSKYRIYHYDVCRGLVGVDAKTEFRKSTADLRPQARRDEQRNIPTQQDWNKLLATGQEPAYNYTTFDFLRTGPAVHDPKFSNRYDIKINFSKEQK